MKIDSGVVGMESARSYKSTSSATRRFVVTEYRETFAQANAFLGTAAGDTAEGFEEKNKSLAKEENQEKTEYGKTTSLAEWQNRFGIRSNRVKMRGEGSRIEEDLRQVTVRYIFELLFSARRNRMKEWMEEHGMDMETDADTVNTGFAWPNVNQNPQLSENMQAFSVNMKRLSLVQETHLYEEEETSFSTVGTVRTSDGREINFNVELSMSRSFESYFREDLQLANFSLCDPLVINMDTDAAELSDQTFYFDIDADGEEDEISMLNGGSGYLALDKNGDGIINDGSELFGTGSGDGFKDLAQYDEDGNGWIDENDAVFSKLKIWCKDASGKDVLYRLAEKGVGAICLQKADTDFSLKDSSGNLKGAVRSTGIFLYENGNVGTLQHVDVAKYQKEA